MTIVIRIVNELLENSLAGIKRLSYDEALASGYIQPQDLIMPYVKALGDVVDMEAIKKAGLKLGVDLMRWRDHDTISNILMCFIVCQNRKRDCRCWCIAIIFLNNHFNFIGGKYF